MQLHEIQSLRDRRMRVVQGARDLHKKITEEEKRQPTAEERAQLDRALQEAGSLGDQIRSAEEDLDRERRLAAAEAEVEATRGTPEPRSRGGAGGGTHEHPAARSDIEVSNGALRAFARQGREGVAEYLDRIDEAQRRSLQVGTLVQGGALVPPVEMQRRIIQAIDDETFVLEMADVQMVDSAQSLGVVSLDSDPSDAEWTAELGTGSDDESMAFGARELHPRPLARRLRVSATLLERRPDAEALIIQRLAYKFGVTFEKFCLTGHGANQPLGVFTASDQGIPTSRDSVCASQTAVSADDFIKAKFKLKAGYWGRAFWTLHRDVLLDVALERDQSGGSATTGGYLWRPSAVAGEPDLLAGIPLRVSEFAPNTKTAGQYVAVLGDWSFYMVAIALLLRIQRLTELYAETNQVGFIGRLEADGMPTLAEAFVRMQLAS